MIERLFPKIDRSKGPIRITSIFLIPFLIALSALFFLLITWERRTIDEDQATELREVAKAFTEQIMVNRIWNAQHGGVYVETTPKTPPNPFLDDPHREIVSVTGKHYTKINPAYMTRQLSEIANMRHGYKFRVVSLQLLNPANAPDPWEKKALIKFDQEMTTEAYEIFKKNDGSRVFKYISPILVESTCLKCHSKMGYSHDDVRGGISISIPMKNSDAIRSLKIKRTIVSYLLIGAVSIFFAATVITYLSSRLNTEINKNIEQEKLAAIIELAGAAAHEMRQPMTVLYNLITLLSDKLKNNESITEKEMQIIIEQSERMNDIIKKMLNITSYETKTYIKGKKIIDLHESSKNK